MAARDFFANLESQVDPTQIDGLDHSYLFDIADEGRWLVEVRNGKVAVTENPDRKADVSFAMSAGTFDRLLAGKQNPMVAYMTGKLKVDGDLSAARELQKLF